MEGAEEGHEERWATTYHIEGEKFGGVKDLALKAFRSRGRHTFFPLPLLGYDRQDTIVQKLREEAQSFDKEWEEEVAEENEEEEEVEGWDEEYEEDEEAIGEVEEEGQEGTSLDDSDSAPSESEYEGEDSEEEE
eukprot:Sspe_Gene.90710::Locus_62209_Transcript_1_1_Confidence_1.000_Length_458::g.90710::m.90710